MKKNIAPQVILQDEEIAFVSRDCDCGDACAPHLSQILAYPIELPGNNEQKYKKAEAAKFLRINGDSELVYISADTLPSKLSGMGVINKSAKNILNLFSDTTVQDPMAYLLDIYSEPTVKDVLGKFILLGVLKKDEEFAAEASVLETRRVLSSWFHITDRCNLRCEYCFLPHIKKDMPIDIGIEAVDALINSALSNGFKRIKIKYAGGEPLIKFDTIKKIQIYAIEQCELNNLELDSVILTNGTLLSKEILGDIKALSIGLSISLDGFGEYQRENRPYIGGGNSSDDVRRGINLAIEAGIKPGISITITPHSLDGVPMLLKWILDKKLHFSLNFYRDNSYSKTRDSFIEDESRIIEGMKLAFDEIEKNLPEYSLLGALGDRANLNSHHLKTCGVADNYLVFGFDGKVSSCQMTMHEPVASLSDKNLLSLVNSNEKGIQNFSVDEKEGCRDCQWKYWCAGGCPLETYRATGRYDIKSPNCNIYKAIFPEILRLEGLRILKYGDTNEKHKRIL